MKHHALPRVVLRTPVLPFDLLARWAEAPDRREVLRVLVADPAVREALYVASPELDAQIDAWVAAPSDHVAVERALVRYLTRMSARSTPFGLFSSVAVAEVGEHSKLELAPRCAAIRHTRLDNDLLFALCADLVKDRGVRRHLRFRTTTSLYAASGRLRYAEARLANLVRTYFLVAVDPTPYLTAVLERAKLGATFDQLVGVLTVDPEISIDEAAGFLDDVIDAQLLVAELAPNVTGREPTETIADALAAAPALEALAEPLRAAQTALAAIDASAPGVPSSEYRAIETTLRALPTKIEPSRLFQVDLFKPATATIGEPVLDELSRGIELLHRLAPAGGDSWARFRERFAARYESRSVPLVEVLDEETGIGFGDESSTGANAPLLANLAFPARGDAGRVSMGPRDVHLMSLVAHALRTGATEIELTDADVEALSQKSPTPLAETLCASAVVVAASSDAVCAGDFQLRINHVGRGANLLGRFCHGSSEVEALTAEALRLEEAHRPDAIFAEVVHLPEGRHGNVLLRPVLRGYEIPYLGASGAPQDKQLDITDLVVSIVDDRVILRSLSRNQEVIPRMTTAHNFGGRSLAIYRFLCSHAAQRVGNAYWSWGALDQFPFLPRVRRGKLILDRARWLLAAKDLAKLDHAAFSKLRARLGLPRWIVIGDSDNELPVDCDNDLMVDSAIALLRNRPSATLFELVPAHDELALQSPEGRFAHELIALFARPVEIVQPSPSIPAVASVVERRFLPGSEWLYLKLYAGAASTDVVLRELAPAIAAAQQAGLVEQWFFLRYADPEPHLRIRFAGDPQTLSSQVLPMLHAVLAGCAARGLVWKIVVDTYEREIERYGGPEGIELAEQLFCADADAALAIVSACEGDAGADAMWRLAVRGCDQLMDDLGLSLADKRALMTSARDAFGAEHGADAAFYKQLGDKFRTHGKELAALLEASHTDRDHLFEPALAAFHARSQRVRPIGLRLRALAIAGVLTQSIDALVHSYVHMHVNRMIRSSQRAHELVLYDLLRRLYDGQAARSKQQIKKTA